MAEEKQLNPKEQKKRPSTKTSEIFEAIIGYSILILILHFVHLHITLIAIFFSILLIIALIISGFRKVISSFRKEQENPYDNSMGWFSKILSLFIYPPCLLSAVYLVGSLFGLNVSICAFVTMLLYGIIALQITRCVNDSECISHNKSISDSEDKKEPQKKPNGCLPAFLILCCIAIVIVIVLVVTDSAKPMHKTKENVYNDSDPFQSQNNLAQPEGVIKKSVYFQPEPDSQHKTSNMQVWIGTSGKKIEAEFIKEENGQIYLNTAEGKCIWVYKQDLAQVSDAAPSLNSLYSPRLWTGQNNTKIYAAFIKEENGQVFLREPGGKERWVWKNHLIAADNNFLYSFSGKNQN